MSGMRRGGGGYMLGYNDIAARTDATRRQKKQDRLRTRHLEIQGCIASQPMNTNACDRRIYVVQRDVPRVV